jgi:hypothetical protein
MPIAEQNARFCSVRSTVRASGYILRKMENRVMLSKGFAQDFLAQLKQPKAKKRSSVNLEHVIVRTLSKGAGLYSFRGGDAEIAREARERLADLIQRSQA